MDPMGYAQCIGALLAIEEAQHEDAEPVAVEQQVEGDDQAENNLQTDVDRSFGRLDRV